MFLLNISYAKSYLLSRFQITIIVFVCFLKMQLSPLLELGGAGGVDIGGIGGSGVNGGLGDTNNIFSSTQRHRLLQYTYI